ncbi:MAG: type II toxin-antitoxin system HicA family toxin [Planctomycetota bacterium]
MPAKLPSLRPREVIRALQRVGFVVESGKGKGSHTFLRRAKDRRTTSVPKGDPVAKGTLRTIIRQAGLTVEQFVDLL